MDLADKLAVAETMYRYAYGADRRDWALYRSVFADTIAVDFSGFDPAMRPAVVSADDWVLGTASLFDGLAATQHSMTNPLVTLHGDAADINMSVQARHVYAADHSASFYTVGGYYDNELARAADGWMLTKVRLTVTWRTGDPAIMALARAARRPVQ